jgi:hypothetical protein
VSLTGTATAVLAVLVVIAVAVATVALWSRLDRFGPARWPLRLAMIGSCQLSAVLLTALLLNDTFVFYQSWSEVFGLHPTQGRPAAAAGALDASLAGVLAEHALSHQGTTIPFSFAGPSTGIHAGPGYVYLPPQYGDPDYAQRNFPVVELLDGFPGSPSTWVHAMHLSSVLTGLINSGRSAPFIALLPDQNVAYPRDTECVNLPGGLQVDQYLTQDVRADAERAFRVAREASQWTVMGDSVGGYCASDLAIRHPGMFGAAVSIAGYNAPAHDSTTQNLFGADPSLANQFSPLWLVQHRRAPNLHLLLISTRSDHTAYRATQQMIAADRAPLQLATLVLPRGGHNFATFVSELPPAFGWLSRFVSWPLAPLPTVDGLGPVPITPPQRRAPRPPGRKGGGSAQAAVAQRTVSG